MPELGLLGSVRGALSNERPYRECGKLVIHKQARSERFFAITRLPIAQNGPKFSAKIGLVRLASEFSHSLFEICTNLTAYVDVAVLTKRGIKSCFVALCHASVGDGACQFFQRGAMGRDRLLKTRRPALLLPEPCERSAEIHLRHRPLERNARAG